MVILGWFAFGLTVVSFVGQGARFLRFVFSDGEPSPGRSLDIMLYVLILMLLSALMGALLAVLT